MSERVNYLLVELSSGRVLEEFLSREQALDEVLAMIREDGPQVTDTLGLMWRGAKQKRGSIQTRELLQAAKARELAPA